MKRGKSYSVCLGGNQLPELKNFLKTRHEKGVVEIDGKKWAAAYRHVFPSEPAWTKSLYTRSGGK